MPVSFDHASPWLVFTDLDGTLLDWGNYSPAIARPAMLRLRDQGIPVVFCSSKTAAEQRALRQQLGIRSIPSIVENGAAIIVPDSAGLPTGDWDDAPGEPGRRVLVLGLQGDEVRARLARVRAKTGLPLLGYHDIDVAKLASLTGLDLEAARRAQQRDYSETLIEPLPQETWDLLRDEFAAEGLECRYGGRFHTVTGAGTDKGRAVTTILQLYERAYERSVKSVGLGDSANDAPLLAAVNRPFLVAREDGTWANLRVDNLQRMTGRGPHGWVETVDLILGEAGTT